MRLILLASMVSVGLLPHYLSSQAPSGTGMITGTIRYPGIVPPPQKIPTTDGGTIIHHDLVVDPKTKGLKFVAVILEDAPAQPKLQKAKPVLVDQRDMIFLPRVVAVQHGQAVRFENNDLCNHSVMATSVIPANQLNTVAGPNQPVEHVFETQKRPLPIGCSLHAWMRAWVFVVPHSFFAVSDAAGQFRIERVPAGKYSLLLHHPDTNYQERRTVEVQAGRTVNLSIEYSAKNTKP